MTDEHYSDKNNKDKYFMAASTKLSNSVKALCFLAESTSTPRNSKEISIHIGVNASKIRKLLSDLSRAGIVKTIQGPSGGFMLAKKASHIHLQEIYCALEHKKAFHLDVGENRDREMEEIALVNIFFLDLFSEIQVDIEAKMKNIKLSHILKYIINHATGKEER